MIKFYLKNTLLHSCKLSLGLALAMACTTDNVYAGHGSLGAGNTPVSQSINFATTAGAITLTGNTFKPTHNIADPIGEFKVGDRLLKEVELIMHRKIDDSLRQINKDVVIHNNDRFEIRDNELYLKSDEGLTDEENKTFVIRVNLVGGDPKQDQYFNIYKATEKPTSPIKIPNAFSPFKIDDFNDTWVIHDLSLYAVVQVEVYDRAGNRLFYTKDPNKGWDGRNKSGQVVPGAYFYVIRIDDINEILRGVVTVYKK